MSKTLINISSRQAFYFACFLVMYEFLTYMANDMILPAMLDVVQAFNADESTVASSLTVYILGGASLQLFLGPISDAYGRRPLMLLGACLFFIFTLLIALSNSMEQFLVIRFFQGMGLCFICVIGYATIQEIYDEMDAIRLIAIMANAAILAPLLGPLLGAIIMNYASWRLIFIVIAFFAVFAFWGLWRFMPEPMGKTKKDGVVIKKMPLSPSSVFQNYKKLLSNPTFCFGTIALAITGIPCIAWIALAPVILISEAKLSVIEYGLWQLPIFGATIIGNLFLRKLTYYYDIKSIIYIGCFLVSLGVMVAAIMLYFGGNNYQNLLPGIMIYFFGLSIINAPLNRFCLYITPVSKGTASAIISLSVMIIGASGIEIASFFYQHHNNLHFALFCNGAISLTLLFIGLSFSLEQQKKSESLT